MNEFPQATKVDQAPELPANNRTELMQQVLEAFAARANWQDTSTQDTVYRPNRFTVCADPATLAQAALQGDAELVTLLLQGQTLAPFTRELNELLAVQKDSDYQPGWVLNQIHDVFPPDTLTRDQWVLLGQKLDYRSGWAYQQWQRHGSAA
ncbi:MAG: hypothetical protein AAFQ61_04165 [Cyanobacteria bacterium J06626_23]